MLKLLLTVTGMLVWMGFTPVTGQFDPFLPEREETCRISTNPRECMKLITKMVSPLLIRDGNCDKDTQCVVTKYADACDYGVDDTAEEKIARDKNCMGANRIAKVIEKFGRIISQSQTAAWGAFPEDVAAEMTKEGFSTTLKTFRDIDGNNLVKSYQLHYLAFDQLVTLRAETRLLAVRTSNVMNELYTLQIVSVSFTILVCATYTILFFVFVLGYCRTKYQERQLAKALEMDKKLDEYYRKRQLKTTERESRRPMGPESAPLC